MKNPLELTLTTTAEQAGRLKALQTEFAAACNAIAPVAQANRCWNRVALHHLTYHDMRQRFPQLGSQMVCNAVYSVSRTYRLILGHPDSPWSLDKRPHQPLPLLKFQPEAPVYFDRHTLSLRSGQLSMYTLDGRIRFQLDLSPEDQQHFVDQRLREIILLNARGRYVLQFWFEDQQTIPSNNGAQQDKTEGGSAAVPTTDALASLSVSTPSRFLPDDMPEYVLVLPPEQAVQAS
jgi:hypothetical protein